MAKTHPGNLGKDKGNEVMGSFGARLKELTLNIQ
jgi:hypothetical protein